MTSQGPLAAPNAPAASHAAFAFQSLERGNFSFRTSSISTAFLGLRASHPIRINAPTNSGTRDVHERIRRI
jgi:hypothetical protein